LGKFGSETSSIGGRKLLASKANILKKLKENCEFEGTQEKNFGWENQGIDIEVDFTLAVEIEIKWFSVKKFEMYVEGSSKLVASMGEIFANIKGEAKSTCSISDTMSLGYVPIVSIIGAGPTLEPVLGVRAELSAAAEVRLKLPSIEKGSWIRAGFKYDDITGAKPIRENSKVCRFKVVMLNKSWQKCL